MINAHDTRSYLRKGGIHINRICKTIITIIGILIFFIILGFCFPVMQEPLLFWWTTIWTIFKEFFFVDVLKKWLLYIAIAGGITACGFWIGRKQEKKIWLSVSTVLDAITFIGFWNYK